MNVFNTKILDASIRDVSSCLSDNQKVELLLYATKNLHFEGYVLSLPTHRQVIRLFPCYFHFYLPVSTFDLQTL